MFFQEAHLAGGMCPRWKQSGFAVFAGVSPAAAGGHCLVVVPVDPELSYGPPLTSKSVLIEEW